MATALSAFVKGDKEIKDKLESMDSTLKKIYDVQVKGQKNDEKWRRRQEQADKRKKADQKAPMGAFKNDKDDKKKGKGLFGKLFDFLSKNPALVKFLAALGGITVAALALKKAFDDLKEGTVIWFRELKKQWTDNFNTQKQKWSKWWDDFKVKTNDGWKNFKTKTSKMFDDIANSRAFKDFKRGFQEAGEALTKKFPGISKALEDVKIKFGKFGKGVTKKGGLIDVLTNNKVSKGLSKGMRGLGKRIPLIGELIFAGVTAKQRADEGQGAGQVALGTGAEVVGGLGGAALGGKAGAALGATIGSFIAPGIGTAIGGALGGFGGAVLGGFGGAEFLGGLADKLYPQISEWVQNTIVAPFQGLMETIGNFWTTNVVEPFLANPVVQWLTPIVEAAGGLLKAFVDFQVALAGFLGRAAKQWFEFVGNIFKSAWDGITGFNKRLVEAAGNIFSSIADKFTGWYKEDVEPWWKDLTAGISEFLEPLTRHFEFLGEKVEQVADFLQDKLLGAFQSLADLLQDGLIGMLDAPKNALNWATNLLNGKQEGGVVTGYQTGGFVGTVPNQGGNGDRFGTMVQAGSVVMNQNAAGYQSGGLVPVMLEQGEIVVPPGPDAGAALMMNDMFPRFQEGGQVLPTSVKASEGTTHKLPSVLQKEKDEKKELHPHLKKLSDENIVKANAPLGYCVTGSLDTMEKSGVPNPSATGDDKGNNPRGGAVQLINSFGWGAIPGGTPITLNSPYGSAASHVMTPCAIRFQSDGRGYPFWCYCIPNKTRRLERHLAELQRI